LRLAHELAAQERVALQFRFDSGAFAGRQRVLQIRGKVLLVHGCGIDWPKSGVALRLPPQSKRVSVLSNDFRNIKSSSWTAPAKRSGDGALAGRIGNIVFMA
jgi:hypothetical protein